MSILFQMMTSVRQLGDTVSGLMTVLDVLMESLYKESVQVPRTGSAVSVKMTPCVMLLMVTVNGKMMDVLENGPEANVPGLLTGSAV